MSVHGDDSLIGIAAGPFRLEKKIGEGGMGAVYLARRIADFEQLAAVKLLLDGHGEEEVAARFHAEQQVLASLNHPNIVRLLDAGVIEGGIPYIAMDYVEGMPLDCYCERTKPDLRQRVHLVISILDALDYAHRRFLAHCDLKYSNVLVEDSGAVHLLDFGIAKLLNLSRYGIENPMTRHFRPFTPEFASPEQLLGRPLTTATDVYTAGVLLYGLLAGEHPFEEVVMQPVTLLNHICSEDPEPPSRRVLRRKNPLQDSQELDADLDAITGKALRKDPDRRYRSAAEFRDDLQRYLDGLPVLARQGTIRYRISKFARRRTGLAVAVLALVAFAVAGTAGTVWEAARAARERSRAEARFKDVRRLANALLDSYHEKLKNFPGSTSAQQLLVTRSLGYLENLASKRGSNRDLAADIAGGYARLAAIQGSPYDDNLGQPNEALATLDKALALAKPAAVSLPGDFAAFLALAHALDTRGDVLFSIGRTKDAVAASQAANDIYERLIKVRPDDVDLIMETAGSHEGLGDKLGGVGLSSLMDTQGAIRNFTRARELDEIAAAIAPKFLRPRRAIALMYMKIADVTWESDQKASLELYAKAKAALDRLSPEELSQYSTRRIRTFILRHAGDAMQELGQYREALQNYEECRALLESTHALDSSNSRAQWDMAVLLHSIAGALQPLGQHREALSYLERLEKTMAGMQGLQSFDQMQNTFGETEFMIAESKLALGDRAGAAEAAERGIAIYSKLAARQDVSPRTLANVGGMFLKVQPAHFQDPQRALACLRRATADGASGAPLSRALYAQALWRCGEKERARELANSLLAEIRTGEKNSLTYRKTRAKLDELLAWR
jgi:tetratricopeptide (TPR) repeat protein